MSKWVALSVAALLVTLPGTCLASTVRVLPEEEVRKRNIDAISAALTAKLPALLKLLETRRRLLQPSADGLAYPAADVEALLSDLERPLLEDLADDDVAPLRDLIVLEFAQARRELNLPRAAAGRAHGVRLAALRGTGEPAPAAGTVDRAATESAFDRLKHLLTRLFSLATDRDLAIDLCVVSKPVNATFQMNAPTLPGRPYGTSTVGRLVNISRGLYGYRITKGAREITCAPPRPGDDWTCVAIDLWDDSRLIWDCDLYQKACKRRDPQKGECKEAKR